MFHRPSSSEHTHTGSCAHTYLSLSLSLGLSRSLSHFLSNTKTPHSYFLVTIQPTSRVSAAIAWVLLTSWGLSCVQSWWSSRADWLSIGRSLPLTGSSPVPWRSEQGSATQHNTSNSSERQCKFCPFLSDKVLSDNVAGRFWILGLTRVAIVTLWQKT